MRGLFARVLAAYGQTVRLQGTGESWRAFLQPVLTQASREEREATALGDVDRRRWLYIGPGDRTLKREDRIAWDGGVYRVRESAAVPLAGETLYCRAVLTLDKEMVGG